MKYPDRIADDSDDDVQITPAESAAEKFIEGVANQSYCAEREEQEIIHTDSPENTRQPSLHYTEGILNTSSSNLFGNIRGWFGGVVGDNTNQQNNQNSRRQSAPSITYVHNTKQTSDRLVDGRDYDSSSTSSDSSSAVDNDSVSDYENEYGEEDLTPQERARARALRYLSNSCVDAGRKAKTATYVRGLERLDLKRKRDWFEKELDIVETEMNKDRGRITNIDSDYVSAIAAKLVLELPCTFDSGANSRNGQVTTYDEYMAKIVNNDDPNQDLFSLWENKEATEKYFSSLQSRLKESLERTFSLEKRIAVMEQAGDEIIMSLCEDLVEVASDSNKAEARYVKKGKELQRRRRREELMYRKKIKKAERRVRCLEERLLSTNEKVVHAAMRDQSVASSDSSESSGDEEQENDEVRLEAKLLSIKTKNEENKADHKADMESIRRQCEQLKLRMSVARLVMEGEENLRDYTAILDKALFNLIDRGEDIPTPPPRIFRARAKLLKVVHHENINEQRLSVSKAFSDATINALEQELIERETLGENMETRCLNDLVSIESETRALALDAKNRIAELEAEARELEETVAACTDENMVVAMEDLVIADAASAPATDNDSSSESGDESDESQSAAVERRVGYLQKSNEDDTKSVGDSEYSTLELGTKNCDNISSAKLYTNDKNVCRGAMDAGEVTSNDTSSRPDLDNRTTHDGDEQDALSEGECSDDETPDNTLRSGKFKDSSEAIPNFNTKSCGTKGNVYFDKQAVSDDVTEAMIISDVQQSIESSSLGKNTYSLESLGQKLKDTLSQYQKAAEFSSAEKIKLLTKMNDIVLQIAKVKGVELESTPNLRKLKSWRRKNSRSDRNRPESDEKRWPTKEKDLLSRGTERKQIKPNDERSVFLAW